MATTDVTHRFLLLPQLQRLADEGWDVLAISAPGGWVGQIEEAGIRHVAWPHAVRAWNPGDDARAFAELVGILRRERVDVLHCHNPKPGVLGRIAGRLVGVPVVLNTVHGFYTVPEDRPARRIPVLSAEMVASRCSTFELYQSEEDLGWARELGIARPGRSRLLGNGIDLSRFDPDSEVGARRAAVRSELGVAADELLVGTIGRMVAEKGYREFFEAAARVRATHPHVRFLAVGSPDPEKADAITDDETARAATDVIMAGWRTDIPDLLAAMDVFVLASWREGLPRAAIEAAAMRVPLILTDIRGCREVVAGGADGILVPPRDAEALVDAVVALADDPTRRDELARRAFTRARTSFDERRVMDTVAGLSRVLAGGVPGGASAAEGASAAGGASAPGFSVARARPGDVERIAHLHAVTMPSAFLPSLGPAFLRRFHRALIAFPDSAAYVARVDGEVVGFVAGVPSTSRFRRWFVTRHGVAAAVAAAPALLRPGAVKGVGESLRYAGRGPTPAAGGTEVPTSSELIAIAVDPGHQGAGIGLALGQAFLAAMSLRGCPRVKVVVGTEYGPAFRLYARLGFVPATDVAVHRGTASRVLVTEGVAPKRTGRISTPNRGRREPDSSVR